MARVLIIEDEETDQFAYSEILNARGHEIVLARTGQEGVDLFIENPPDLAIVDIMLPGKDGFETIQEIAMSCPDARIIAVTAYDDRGKNGYLALAEFYGAVESLHKPVDPHELQDAVEKILAQEP